MPQYYPITYHHLEQAKLKNLSKILKFRSLKDNFSSQTQTTSQKHGR